MTELQEKVFQFALEELDKKFPGKEISCCTDLFYNRRALSSDHKIQELGISESVSKLVDDTLYWMGYFSGVPGV